MNLVDWGYVAFAIVAAGLFGFAAGENCTQTSSPRSMICEFLPTSASILYSHKFALSGDYDAER